MKIALITDTHAGARNDLDVIANAQTKFYTDTFFPVLDSMNIKHVLHLGDFFDRRKHINFKSLDVIKNSFLIPLQERNIDFGLICGNHDVFFKNTNELNSPSLLIKDYCKWLWTTEPAELAFDGLKIALIPWINHQNYDDVMEFVNKTNASICMGHFEFDGFEMIRGIMNDGGMQIKPFEKFHSVFSGHFHHKSTRGNITYLGSPFFLNWSDHGDKRGFHILDTETLRLDFIENPVPLFHKIKYDKKPSVDLSSIDIKNSFIKILVHEKDDAYLFDKFVDSIADRGPYDLQIVDLQSETALATEEQIQQCAKDTITIIHETVNELEITDNTKKGIKQLMSELYSEAQNGEEIGV